MKIWTGPMLLLLAACSPEAEAPVNQAEEPVAEQEAATVPQLDGEWRVTGVNGEDLKQAYTMNASFADGRLTIASDCVRFAWAYTQDRNIVAFTPAPAQSCERVRTTNEDQVAEVIPLANIAMFSEDGSEVELSGPGGRVAMTRR